MLTSLDWLVSSAGASSETISRSRLVLFLWTIDCDLTGFILACANRLLGPPELGSALRLDYAFFLAAIEALLLPFILEGD